MKLPLAHSVAVFSLGIILLLPLTVTAKQEAANINGLSAEDLFHPDKVTDVSITLLAEDWDTIRQQSRAFATSLGREVSESPFTYVKGDISINGVVIKDVGIRKKGFLGSLDSNRPSLKIRFDKFVDQDPVTGLDRLTLNNNKQDPTRVCQFLSYKMFRESGTTSPRCGIAKVTVNGDYLGLYSHVESIRKPFLKRGFGDDSGGLFEGTVADFYPGWINKFEKKNKKAKLGSIRKVTDILNAEKLDLKELGKEVDVDAFIEFWAMESLIGFWDGYCNNQNNYFIYESPDDSRLRFIPWGTDSAFTKRMPLPPYRIVPRSVHCQSIMANKLYRVPAIQEQYTNTLMKFLDEHWNEEVLLEELDRLEKLLKDHVLESNKSFARSFKSYRRFVKSRREDIMEEFENGPPELPARERLPIYFGETGTAKVKYKTHWYDKTPKDMEGLGDVEIELTMNGEIVELEQPAAYAERSKWPSEDEIKPPSIVITGIRKSDGKRLTLGTGLSNDLFNPTKGESVEIGGIFMVGASFMTADGRMRMIGGSATFEETSTKEGETVSGTMELTIMEMKGGKPAGTSEDEK